MVRALELILQAKYPQYLEALYTTVCSFRNYIITDSFGKGIPDTRRDLKRDLTWRENLTSPCGEATPFSCTKRWNVNPPSGPRKLVT
jgi:hypothetical protein